MKAEEQTPPLGLLLGPSSFWLASQWNIAWLERLGTMTAVPEHSHQKVQELWSWLCLQQKLATKHWPHFRSQTLRKRAWKQDKSLATNNLSVRFLPNPTHRHVDNLVAASEPVIEGWFASSLPNLSYLLQDWRYCAQEHWFLQAGHSMSNSYSMRSGLSYPHTPEQSSGRENWMTRWSNRHPQNQGVLTKPDLK